MLDVRRRFNQHIHRTLCLDSYQLRSCSPSMRDRDRHLELTMTIIGLWTHLLLCQQGKAAVPWRIVFSSSTEEENIYAFAQLNHEGIRGIVN